MLMKLENSMRNKEKKKKLGTNMVNFSYEQITITNSY